MSDKARSPMSCMWTAKKGLSWHFFFGPLFFGISCFNQNFPPNYNFFHPSSTFFSKLSRHILRTMSLFCRHWIRDISWNCHKQNRVGGNYANLRGKSPAYMYLTMQANLKFSLGSLCITESVKPNSNSPNICKVPCPLGLGKISRADLNFKIG